MLLQRQNLEGKVRLAKVAPEDMNDVTLRPTHAEQYFRTGDFGYIGTSDGAVNFTGRRDQQIKVRGHRVELLEVEEAVKAFLCKSESSRLSSDSEAQQEYEVPVPNAAVVALRDPSRIICYVVPASSDCKSSAQALSGISAYIYGARKISTASSPATSSQWKA